MAPKSRKSSSKDDTCRNAASQALLNSITDEFLNSCPEMVLGEGIPKEFSGPPWQLPLSAGSRAESVNKVLNHSMSLQRGTMPGPMGFLVGDNKPSLAVCGLVQSYLNAVLGKGLAELTDPVDVVVGVYKWSSDISDVDHTYGIPYVWLEVLGKTMPYLV